MCPSPTTLPGNSEGKTEKITNPSRITGLLLRIQEGHSLLNVGIPDSPGAYNSAILEVHAKQNYLVLDELNPKSGHDLLLKTGRLLAHARLKGVDIRFEAVVESMSEHEGSAFYRMTLPTTLDHHQQRAYYRTSMGKAKLVKIYIERSSGEQVAGFLNDISVGGVGMRFNNDAVAALMRGETIPRCRIQLPSGDDIICAIEIRFVSVGVEGNYRMVGARFVRLSQAQELTIARYVAALDKELAKKLTAS